MSAFYRINFVWVLEQTLEKSLEAIVLALSVSIGIFYLAGKEALTVREEKIAGNWYAGHNKRKEGG